MTHAIIIGSYCGSPWLADCLRSMPKLADTPVIVVCEPNYECGKLAWVLNNTTLDEFLYLPDTCVVKDQRWVRDIFHLPGSVAVCNEPGPFGWFAGKYRREILVKCPLPHTPDKMSAVMAEATWTREYAAAETIGVTVLWPDLQHGPSPKHIELKHGRQNAVLENEHIKKWKGTWNVPQVADTERRDRVLAGRL